GRAERAHGTRSGGLRLRDGSGPDRSSEFGGRASPRPNDSGILSRHPRERRHRSAIMEATQTVALREAASDRPALSQSSDPGTGRTITALFQTASRHEPGTQTAMRWKRRGIWEAVSRAEYATAVREVGSALIACGLMRGDRVAILSEN